MKRIFTIIVATVLMAMPLWAQENKRPRFNPEEFKAKMEAYIIQKAELTPSEAERVMPIFQEMKSKQFEVMKRMQKLRLKEEDKLDDEEKCQKALTLMGELAIESAKIEANYYKKISKAVSAKKAYRIKMVDNSFHREALRHVQNGYKDRSAQKRRP